jgi:leucyl-tRNA synthetase
VCGGDKGMHLGLVQRFVEVQCLLMGPITPHTCEHIWANLLNKTGPLVRARMPVAVVTPEHANLQMAGKYLQDLISDLRKMVAKVEQPKKPKKGETALPVAKVTGATMYVKETFTGWHRLCLSVLSSCFNSKTREFASDVDRQVLDALAQDPEAAASCEGEEIMTINLLMPVQQNSFTLLRILLVLTDCGILAHATRHYPSK